MPTEYEKVPESVLHIAQDLIDAHHTDRNLESSDIGFIFRLGPPAVSQGKKIGGKASKVPARYKPYLQLDFLIELSQEVWDDFSLDQRKALLDHELAHCDFSDGEASIRPHDIEEFNEILERWGLWNIDLLLAKQSFQRAVQIILPGVGEKKAAGKVTAVDPAKLKKAEKGAAPA
jgi:hypothetical protein